MEIATENKTWFEDFSLRAALSLQHLWRIGEAMQVDWWLGGVAFLTGDQAATQARVAWHLWKKMHIRPDDAEENEEESQLDVWDLKYGRRADELKPQATSSNLPRFAVLDADTTSTVSPFLAVEVDELPKASDIEWQGLGSRCEQATLQSTQNYVSTIADGKYSYVCLEIVETDASLQDTIRSLMDSSFQGQDLSQVTVYTTQPVEGLWSAQIVPCRSVWGRAGRRLAAGVVLKKEVGVKG